MDVTPIVSKALGLDKEKLDESFSTGDYIPHWAVLVLLESGSMKKRHHQANALLASRLWLRYLAMVSGVLLICVGSIFILAKLSENVTNLGGEARDLKLQISSSSPGLIMTVLGCALIALSVVHNPAISLQDGRAYMSNENSPLPGVSQ